MRKRFAVLVAAAFVALSGVAACGGGVEEKVRQRVDEEVQQGKQRAQEKVDQEVQKAMKTVEQGVQKARKQVEEKAGEKQ